MKNIRDALVLLALASGLLALWSPAWGQVSTPTPEKAGIDVEGVGVTVSDAKDDAGERACEQFRDYLAGKYPKLLWLPDPAYLWRKGLVELKGEPVQKELRSRDGDPVTVHQVTLRLHLGGEDVKELDALNRPLQAKERDLRARERHRLAALVLTGIAAGLVVLKLYLWLEEATRGYWAGLLRLAALVLLGLVIAVLIWLA
jgi:hypothetical protein